MSRVLLLELKFLYIPLVDSGKKMQWKNLKKILVPNYY